MRRGKPVAGSAWTADVIATPLQEYLGLRGPSRQSNQPVVGGTQMGSDLKSFVRGLTLNRISGGLTPEAGPTAAPAHFL
jgi:hypothetical protein